MKLNKTLAPILLIALLFACFPDSKAQNASSFDYFANSSASTSGARLLIGWKPAATIGVHLVDKLLMPMVRLYGCFGYITKCRPTNRSLNGFTRSCAAPSTLRKNTAITNTILQYR